MQVLYPGASLAGIVPGNQQEAPARGQSGYHHGPGQPIREGHRETFDFNTPLRALGDGTVTFRGRRSLRQEVPIKSSTGVPRT